MVRRGRQIYEEKSTSKIWQRRKEGRKGESKKRKKEWKTGEKCVMMKGGREERKKNEAQEDRKCDDKRMGKERRREILEVKEKVKKSKLKHGDT